METYQTLLDLVKGLEADVLKAEAGNKAAQKRVRTSQTPIINAMKALKAWSFELTKSATK